MDYQQIIAERHQNVLLLTLNRPERLNAWTPLMTSELRHAIDGANEDPGIGAVVVTGQGRGFCAGADIGGEFATQLDEQDRAKGAESADRTVPSAAADWVTFCRRSKPLLAAINGPCIGVGLTMVLPFDRLVAAPGAKISARFVKMGLVPELASSHFLAARCGWGAASWLALSGTTIDGTEAARIRLVDRVADGDVLEQTMAEASELAANPAPQLRMIKELLTANAYGVDLSLAQNRELHALNDCYRTPEFREAVSAFMEKRPPKFSTSA